MTVVGVIGGGQLARMMIGPAIELGLELRVLAETENSSARDRATMVGDYRDIETVREFARGVDVITFDHEHVPGVRSRVMECQIKVAHGNEYTTRLKSRSDCAQVFPPPVTRVIEVVLATVGNAL